MEELPMNASSEMMGSSHTCQLGNYGVSDEHLSATFLVIVDWLNGKGLPWQQTRYINLFLGHDGKPVVELLFFHYDGPPEHEIGCGGELNYCKIYLYHDRVTTNFMAENSTGECSFSFKYSSAWTETDRHLLEWIESYLVSGVFARPKTVWSELEEREFNTILGIIGGVLRNEIVG
jgi:hypothetical protein